MDRNRGARRIVPVCWEAQCNLTWQIVPYKPVQAAEIVDLWNRSFPRAFPLVRRLFDQNTRDDPNFAPAGAFVVVREGRVLGYASGKVCREDIGAAGRMEGQGWLSCVFVDPEARRQGIGRALVQAVEGFLRQQGAVRMRAGGDLFHFFPGIPEATGSAGFFSRLGFQLGRRVFDLRGDLSSFRRTQKIQECFDSLEGKVAFRPAREEEWPQVEEFFAHSFPGRWHYEAMAFRRAGGAARDMMVSVENGRILGAAHIYTPESALIGSPVYWLAAQKEGYGGLGPIGVEGEQRGRGIGLALLAAGLEELRRRGARQGGIDWTELVDFYAMVGFHPWQAYVQAEKALDH